ncbi:arylamine N-acetyltransferase family protein [Sandaracinus amylolyticus]|nr:arylamine N-acetyltransferase [Sandaracinus amylolyticus]
MTIDVDAYFARIGYQGSRAPTLETLRALHALHPRAIPFENLDPYSRRGVELSPGALEAKLVRSARGGYCYEQNGLFMHVLRALGFEVHGRAARVRWGVPDDVVMPRSHMTLRVELEDGPYLADVGFGLLTPVAPLRIVDDVEQQTPLETLRMRTMGEGRVVEAKSHDGWRALYWLDDATFLAPDYETLNWFTSTHPTSRFVRNLIVARPTRSGRLTLVNRELTHRTPERPAEVHTIQSVAELRGVLEREFGIDLSRLDDIDASLERALVV